MPLAGFRFIISTAGVSNYVLLLWFLSCCQQGMLSHIPGIGAPLVLPPFTSLKLPKLTHSLTHSPAPDYYASFNRKHCCSQCLGLWGPLPGWGVLAATCYHCCCWWPERRQQRHEPGWRRTCRAAKCFTECELQEKLLLLWVANWMELMRWPPRGDGNGAGPSPDEQGAHVEPTLQRELEFSAKLRILQKKTSLWKQVLKNISSSISELKLHNYIFAVEFKFLSSFPWNLILKSKTNLTPKICNFSTTNPTFW